MSMGFIKDGKYVQVAGNVSTDLETKVKELEAKVAKLESYNTLEDWVDVGDTAVNFNPNNFTVEGVPIIRYRKLGPHIMQLACEFRMKYVNAVNAGVERQEDYFKFNIPAVLSHRDPYVNITGYTRGSAGLINPILTFNSIAVGSNTAVITVNAKILHTEARAVNSTEDFNFNGLVFVERWLS